MHIMGYSRVTSHVTNLPAVRRAPLTSEKLDLLEADFLASTRGADPDDSLRRMAKDPTIVEGHLWTEARTASNAQAGNLPRC